MLHFIFADDYFDFDHARHFQELNEYVEKHKGLLARRHKTRAVKFFPMVLI